MTMYVTRVAVTRADEPTRRDIGPASGRELFRVSWTLSKSGDIDQHFTQSHSTLSSAQAHATKLLQRMPQGASVADVYSENLDDDLPCQTRSSAERCVCGHPSHPGSFCYCGCSISETDNGRDASAYTASPQTTNTGN
jgi:hypothetical protein